MFDGDTGRQRHYLCSAAFSRNWYETVNYWTSVVDVRTMNAVVLVVAVIALHEWRPKFRWFDEIIKVEHKCIWNQTIIHFCSLKECKRLYDSARPAAVKCANTLHNEREQILDFILIFGEWIELNGTDGVERSKCKKDENAFDNCGCTQLFAMRFMLLCNYVIEVSAIESSMLIGEWHCAIQNQKPKPQSVRRGTHTQRWRCTAQWWCLMTDGRGRAGGERKKSWNALFSAIEVLLIQNRERRRSSMQTVFWCFFPLLTLENLI